MLDPLRRDREIDRAFRGHLSNLDWRPLVHVQCHIRIIFNELIDQVWQSISSLGVGRRDTELALRLVFKFLGHSLDTVHLESESRQPQR